MTVLYSYDPRKKSWNDYVRLIVNWLQFEQLNLVKSCWNCIKTVTEVTKHAEKTEIYGDSKEKSHYANACKLALNQNASVFCI